MSGERIHEARLLFILWFGSLSANCFNCWSCLIIIFSLATISSILFKARSVYVPLLVIRESVVEIGMKVSLSPMYAKTWCWELLVGVTVTLNTFIIFWVNCPKLWTVTPPRSITATRPCPACMYAEMQVSPMNWLGVGNSIIWTPHSSTKHV